MAMFARLAAEVLHPAHLQVRLLAALQARPLAALQTALLALARPARLAPPLALQLDIFI